VPLATERITFRRYLVLAAVFVCATIGDFFLKIGMNQVGTINRSDPFQLVRAIGNPWVVLGVLVLIGFFSSYLYALSWADLSFVMPATAFGYVLTGLLAATLLHEHVSPRRWAGIFLITLAVGFVTTGPSKTVRESAP